VIFTTVGTHTVGFDRLLIAVDVLAGQIEEEIVIQFGTSKIPLQHATSYQWLNDYEMNQMINKSSVVISHGGAGSILQILQAGKPLIVAPRLTIYGENHNDHQCELANALEEKGWGITIKEITPDTLKRAISQAMQLNTQRPEEVSLISALKKQLVIWQE